MERKPKVIDLNLTKSQQREKQIQAMKKLGMTDEDIKELLEYDNAVNKSDSPTEYDLKGEKLKNAQEITRTTGKKATPEEPKKAPTVYQLDNTGGKRNKKKNATKADLIEKIANLIAENAENVNILNPERQISFTIGENTYEITLSQKRKPKS